MLKWISILENLERCEKATPAEKKKMVSRKNDENYLQFGFISTQDPDFSRSLCLLYGKKLSNQAMMFSKLKRHYEGKHELVAHKDEKFFCVQKHRT